MDIYSCIYDKWISQRSKFSHFGCSTNDFFGGFLLVFSLYKYYAKLIIYISEIINVFMEKGERRPKRFLNFFYPFYIGL